MNETMVPTQTARDDARQPRKLSRQARRAQLIEATIETLAVRGYARTTLTDVANQAGLSHGLVNFHFETKEKLLSETLVYLSEEYRANWTEALAQAGPSPAERLEALMRADFSPALCTPARLSAWCAFWGEAQCRPLYQEHCGSNDEEYSAVLLEICTDLAAAGGYSFHPSRASRVIRVTLEGVWLDMMTMNAPYPLCEGLATVHACAAAFFPQHFDEAGLIAPRMTAGQ